MVQPLSDADLLELWERGREAGPVARALLLLAAARPALDEAARARLPLPARDAALHELRLAHEGPRLAGRAGCPSCAGPLEFDLDALALHGAAQAEAEVGGELELDGGLRFRVPCSEDLAAVAGAPDDGQAALALMQRCCVAAPAWLSWTPSLLADIEARLAAHAAPCGVELRFLCPACGHAWDAPLDIAAFLWEECEQRAAAVLDDVDRLASRYHWSEAAILGMSPARRRAYLRRCDS
jgi:hypothetical protein